MKNPEESHSKVLHLIISFNGDILKYKKNTKESQKNPQNPSKNPEKFPGLQNPFLQFMVIIYNT